MALLQFEGVSKRFHRGTEEVVALDEVDLSIDAGEFVALIGPSGSGKSTLLHLAGGLDQPDSGRILLGDRDLATMSIGERAKLRRREIGFVFQFFHLIPTLTVTENVELPLAARRREEQRPHRRSSSSASASVIEPPTCPVSSPAASCSAPPSRVRSSPTRNADPRRRAHRQPRLRDERGGARLLAEQVAESGAALVMVTHDAGVASRAGRVHTLRDGRLEDH